MKRDSKLWWFLMAGAIITSVSSRMDLLDPLLPVGTTDKAHAIIELLALLVGVVSGVMRASPINTISDEGREHYIAKTDTVKLGRR